MPTRTGSSAVMKTTGTVVVEALAAWAATVLNAAITATGRRANSVAIAGKCSV